MTVNLLLVRVAITPAGPGGDGDLSVALRRGEDSAQIVCGVEETGGGEMGVPFSGFPAARQSQPRPVQCCPLLRRPPITGKLIYTAAVLWGGERCTAALATHPSSGKSFQLKDAFTFLMLRSLPLQNKALSA